jgi:hypothetical protein
MRVVLAEAMPAPDALFQTSELRAFLTQHKRHLFPLRDAQKTGIVLRHDVDLELGPARALADLEMAVGVRSTLFFLTTAETYNVRARTARAQLRSLVDDGFEVGLHFDPTFYPEASETQLAACAKAEAALLEDSCGAAVESLSLHNPTLLGRFPLIAGFRNAYDPSLFSKERYLSDSGMQFRSDPYTFFQSADTCLMQLLLHPIHYTESGRRYPSQMVAYVRRQAQVVHEAFLPSSVYRASAAQEFFPALRADAATWTDAALQGPATQARSSAETGR